MGGGVRGEGKMYGESSMETYITKCKIESQWAFAVHPRIYLLRVSAIPR